MSDLTVHLFIFDYRIWYQNGRIPKYVSWGIVTLLRKNLYKRDAVDNLRHITLLNTEITFLAEVLVISLARALDRLVGEAQTSAIPRRSIHGNHHLLPYTLERVNRITGKVGSVAHLDQ